MPRSPSPESAVRRKERNRHFEKDGYANDRAGPSSSSTRADGDRSKRQDGRADSLGRRDKRDDGDRLRDHGKVRDRDNLDERRDRKRDRSRSREKDEERRHRKDRRRKDPRSASPSDRDRDRDRDRQQRKEAKAAARATARRETELEQSRALAEVSMYSAADNPFHDVNLGEQFVWNKKREKERKAGLTSVDIAQKDARRRLEAKEELERLNKRRADREVEMALREEETLRQQRMAEEAQMAEWVAKEDDFQLEQSRRRAGIRLREQRAKAIDFLAINLRFADAKALGRHTAAIGAVAGAANPHKSEIEREDEEEGWGWADAGFEFEIDEPWRIFDNLNLEDCVELEQDIKMYLSLEKSPINVEFWEAMLVVCQYNLEQLRDEYHATGGRLFDKDVDEAAGDIVSGLSLQRLIELENKTNTMLRSGQPVDGEFWDLVLKKIHVEKSIAKLNSIHEVVLKNRLEQFKKRQREDATRVQAELSAQVKPVEAAPFGGDIRADVDEDGDADDEVDAEEDDWVEEYSKEMSPAPVDPSTMIIEERRLPIVTEADERASIFKKRHEVVNSSLQSKNMKTAAPPQAAKHTAQSVARPSAADLEAERYYREEAEREKRELGSDESEEEFGDLDQDLDLQLPAPANYDWSDRYRPRKPRFFNRVHTGFEWTRYNQTHYDTDNPPPKVVQGYKFNIFYPDLIDKSKAPTYHLKPIPDDPDTEIIVFTAGPPYEDIAFRIVKYPWVYSHRKGFRSMFDRGVLQLYFNFGREYYRM